MNKMEYHQLHEIENLRLLKMMIAEGFNPNAYDKFGLTPLHYTQNPEVVEFLLNNGANMYKRSIDEYKIQPFDYCDDSKVLTVYLKHMNRKLKQNNVH